MSSNIPPNGVDGYRMARYVSLRTYARILLTTSHLCCMARSDIALKRLQSNHSVWPDSHGGNDMRKRSSSRLLHKDPISRTLSDFGDLKIFPKTLK